jgi:hypothetical protein
MIFTEIQSQGTRPGLTIPTATSANPSKVDRLGKESVPLAINEADSDLTSPFVPAGDRLPQQNSGLPS